MKFLLSLAILAIIAFTTAPPIYVDSKALNVTKARIRQSAIACAPDWTGTQITEMAEGMIPLPGTGKWNWKISTKNDSAQFYFNQGIRLYYGFHLIEAVPSFRKAQQFDPNCGILYWGEALALGPNINDVGYTNSAAALAASRMASRKKSGATALESLLIEAMQIRYSADSSITQSTLNEHYAVAMRGIHAQFKQEADAAVLFADALMLLHPWDFWYNDGSPKPWTPELMSLLEEILDNRSNHPGANHYYIHVVEASPYPEKAMKSAKRLGRLAPGLSHMVHMPSHIYIRTGNSQNGISVNTKAVEQYKRYLELYPAVADNAALYEIHNRHMQAACAIQVNDYATAIELSNGCRASIVPEWLADPAFGYYIQYMYLSPEFARIIFKDWDGILLQPEIPVQYRYAHLLQRFSKGLAHARKNESRLAREDLAVIDTLLTTGDFKLNIGPMNPPLRTGSIARMLLQGTIAETEGDLDEAIRAYSDAVAAEDSLSYDEPRDWLLPTRQFLGEALMRKGEFETAGLVFETLLKKNPGNAFAKTGLNASYRKKMAD
jgi:tetratricopeptide (TPR) repeat protein